MENKNKYSIYTYTDDRWMHVFSYPTKAEAERNRRFYKRGHPRRRTKIVRIGQRLP